MKKMITVVLLLTVAVAFADDTEAEITSGSMLVVGEDGIVGDLPLQHTDVEITTSGNLQRVTAKQVHDNPYDYVIEEKYGCIHSDESSQYFDALENPIVSDYNENALESPEALGAFSTSILKNILPNWSFARTNNPGAFNRILQRPIVANNDFVKIIMESPESRFHDWREHLEKMSPKQFKGISGWLNALVGHHETLEALYDEHGIIQDLRSNEWSDIVNEIAGEEVEGGMGHANWGVIANMSNILTQMDNPLAREFYINVREDQPEDVFLKCLGIDFGETIIPERAVRLIEGLPNPDDYTLGQLVDTLLQRNYMEQPLIQLIRDAIKKDTKTIPNRPHFLKEDDVEENTR